MIDYRLAKGSHSSREAGMCAMEWVAYVAGEEHTDQPGCVSPVLKTFCIPFNDALPDDQRQRLRPYLTRCIGTAGDQLDEQRAWMATDWLVREFTPAWLDLGGLHTHAQNLRALGEVLSTEMAESAQATLNAARTDAAAAGDAAWAAAGDAAWAAARAAAWDAARDEGSYNKAYQAALKVGKPTSDELIDSAFDLLDRMLPTEHVAIPEPFKAELDRLIAA